jgi:putative membrane protein
MVKADIPANLDDSSQKKLDKLRNAKPADFSGEYDPMQVSLFERYSKGGGATASTGSRIAAEL